MKTLISKKDKIFIAGHLGMAGNAILRAFKKKGYENILCFKRSELDLEDINQVEKFMYQEKPNIVVLAAAKVGGIMANSKYPADFILRNLKIQTNLIESSWRNNVRRFLFLGSSCIYPKFSEQPIREEYLLKGYLEETNEYYALAKIAGIKLCQALHKQHGFDAICLMPTNLYGPGDNYDLNTSHVLPALIRKFSEAKKNQTQEVLCWGDGSPYREFLHCDDLGAATLFVLENVTQNNINQIKKINTDLIHINVGTSKEISIKELAKLIAQNCNYTGNIKWDLSKPNGTHQKKLNTRLINDLGWEPKIKLSEGIKMTISDYEKLYF
tara:strand:+ start:1969 stop:2946 length:978 start_codon:yes stop_codon:yes gene_type:complete